MKNGMSGEHWKVESTYDPRTNAVLDNCNEIIEVLLNAEQTYPAVNDRKLITYINQIITQ